MLIQHEGSSPNAVDPSLQRVAAGTIGDTHMLPSGVAGAAIGNVISPFDSRVTTGGTWTIQAGANITSFLSYSAYSTAPGSNMTVSFVGSSIAIIGSNLQNGGRFDVYVDGVLTTGIVNTTAILQPNYYVSSNRSLNPQDTTIVVSSTSNFTSSGTIQIDKEQITYTSLGTATINGVSGPAFLGCTRGANDTQAASHVGGISVYSANSTVETYTAYDQARIILWRANNLSPGPHTLQVVLRSDKNASSSGTQITIDGFVLGGLVGASNLHTEMRYITISGTTDGSGIIHSIQLTPDNTGSQLIGFMGAYPISGCVWCFPMWDPSSQFLSIVTNAATTAVSVTLTAVFAAPTF